MDLEQGKFWAQVASAVGTLLAVLVALFAQSFRSKFFPPKLTLELGDLNGRSTPVRLRFLEGEKVVTRDTDARYYYVRVRNERRWSPATQAQVVLLRVETLGPAGAFVSNWSGEVPIHWAPQTTTPPSVTIGTDRPADLCSVVKDKWLQLHPQAELFALPAQWREACHFRLTLQCRSVEADSALLVVQVDWDGRWSDGAQEMRRHLHLGVVTEPVVLG